VVTHQQRHQRQHDEATPATSSTALRQPKRTTIEASGAGQKLPGGGAGREQAQHDAAAFREPAVGDHGPRTDAMVPVPSPTTTPHSNCELPRRGHQGGEGDAGGDERERRHHDAPDAESVHQPAMNGPDRP